MRYDLREHQGQTIISVWTTTRTLYALGARELIIVTPHRVLRTAAYLAGPWQHDLVMAGNRVLPTSRGQERIRPGSLEEYFART